MGSRDAGPADNPNSWQQCQDLWEKLQHCMQERLHENALAEAAIRAQRCDVDRRAAQQADAAAAADAERVRVENEARKLRQREEDLKTREALLMGRESELSRWEGGLSVQAAELAAQREQLLELQQTVMKQYFDMQARVSEAKGLFALLQSTMKGPGGSTQLPGGSGSAFPSVPFFPGIGPWPPAGSTGPIPSSTRPIALSASAPVQPTGPFPGAAFQWPAISPSNLPVPGPSAQGPLPSLAAGVASPARLHTPLSYNVPAQGAAAARVPVPVTSLPTCTAHHNTVPPPTAALGQSSDAMPPPPARNPRDSDREQDPGVGEQQAASDVWPAGDARAAGLLRAGGLDGQPVSTGLEMQRSHRGEAALPLPEAAAHGQPAGVTGNRLSPVSHAVPANSYHAALVTAPPQPARAEVTGGSLPATSPSARNGTGGPIGSDALSPLQVGRAGTPPHPPADPPQPAMATVIAGGLEGDAGGGWQSDGTRRDEMQAYGPASTVCEQPAHAQRAPTSLLGPPQGGSIHNKLQISTKSHDQESQEIRGARTLHAGAHSNHTARAEVTEPPAPPREQDGDGEPGQASRDAQALSTVQGSSQDQEVSQKSQDGGDVEQPQRPRESPQQAIVHIPRSSGRVQSTESNTHHGRQGTTASLARSAPPVESRPHPTATDATQLQPAKGQPQPQPHPPPPMTHNAARPLNPAHLFQPLSARGVGGGAGGGPGAVAPLGFGQFAAHPQFGGLMPGTMVPSALPFSAFPTNPMLDQVPMFGAMRHPPHPPHSHALELDKTTSSAASVGIKAPTPPGDAQGKANAPDVQQHLPAPQHPPPPPPPPGHLHHAAAAAGNGSGSKRPYSATEDHVHRDHQQAHRNGRGLTSPKQLLDAPRGHRGPQGRHGAKEGYHNGKRAKGDGRWQVWNGPLQGHGYSGPSWLHASLVTQSNGGHNINGSSNHQQNHQGPLATHTSSEQHNGEALPTHRLDEQCAFTDVSEAERAKWRFEHTSGMPNDRRGGKGNMHNHHQRYGRNVPGGSGKSSSKGQGQNGKHAASNAQQVQQAVVSLATKISAGKGKRTTGLRDMDQAAGKRGSDRKGRPPRHRKNGRKGKGDQNHGAVHASDDDTWGCGSDAEDQLDAAVRELQQEAVDVAPAPSSPCHSPPLASVLQPCGPLPAQLHVALSADTASALMADAPELLPLLQPLFAPPLDVQAAVSGQGVSAAMSAALTCTIPLLPAPALPIRDDFSCLKGVMQRLSESSTSNLERSAASQGIAGEGEEGKTRWTSCGLECLLEQVEALREKSDDVTWGWCRELRAFVFVILPINRIVVEWCVYKTAAYFFEVEEPMPLELQLARLIWILSARGMQRGVLLLSSDAAADAHINATLTAEEQQVLQDFGWQRGCGIRTMLNFTGERFIHDYAPEGSAGKQRMRSRLKAMFAAAARTGRVTKAVPPGLIAALAARAAD